MMTDFKKLQSWFSGHVLRAALVFTLPATWTTACVSPENNQSFDVANVEGTLTASEVYQGWSPYETELWYYTSQGSRLVPLTFMRALEQPNSTAKFFTRESLEGFGLLFAPRPSDAAARAIYDQLNPGGALPIGFALDARSPGEPWVGPTCAACHTREVTHRGNSLLLQGAGALLDFLKLESALAEAFRATRQDPAKLARFQKAVPQFDRARFDAYVDGLNARVERDTPAVGGAQPGPGRFDALNTLTNEFVGTALGLPQNYVRSTAPVNYPHLWAPIGQLDWAQWIPLAHSALRRNFGEAVGVFAGAVFNANGTTSYGADIAGIDLLEELVDKLQPPRLPTPAFGSINCSSATRGRALYQSTCLSCHSVSETGAGACGFSGSSHPMVGPLVGPDGQTTDRRFVATGFVPVAELGVDDAMVRTLSTRQAETGAFAPFMGGQTRASAVAILGQMQLLMLSQNLIAGYPAVPTDPAQLALFRDVTADRIETLRPTPERLGSLKSTPLSGVCATGPYLHNGSVRTLRELLLPPAQRARSFRVGATSREYNPIDCGPLDIGPFVFDATVVGNSSRGHVYGTNLTATQRRDLLEYLRTL